ncbi:multidrug efflux SMR transporter [Pseudogemmatithrix spongiicola]|uniref:Guanidinium exporter n=1 Tax=Pseudogemmatithrix spongiicola TaxID=3062599 RepID=A0AA49K118_9BACT|nr:multidrug efflux SMR transporter [Gemmatimonadaceae bacterium 'strain 138']WKW15802.1 multidrug efflux SMR transporter [Gemmatimonadaceae bacterium 'strain 318']
MNWFLLTLAGLLEVGWAIGLKKSEGFAHLGPSLATLGAMALSFWLLSIAMRSLPLGTAYPVWVGIGAVGSVVAGSWLFGESLTVLRVVSVLLIIVGIIGLKLATPVPG